MRPSAVFCSRGLRLSFREQGRNLGPRCAISNSVTTNLPQLRHFASLPANKAFASWKTITTNVNLASGKSIPSFNPIWTKIGYGVCLLPLLYLHSEELQQPTDPKDPNSPLPFAITDPAVFIPTQNTSLKNEDRPSSLLVRILLFPVSVAKICYRVLVLSVFFTPVFLSFPLWFYMNRDRIRNALKPGVVTSTDKWGKSPDDGIRLWWVELCAWALERSGPLFIKLGQWASSRADLIPPEICAVLARLQNKVRPHAFKATRHAVQDIFEGKDLDLIFSEFDEVPVGVGAVAQVHRAVLRNSSSTDSKGGGLECAVKVLHPGVEERIEIDLQLLKVFGAIVSCWPGAKYLSIGEEITTFDRMMRDQLDLRVEARNLDVFLAHFEGPLTNDSRKAARTGVKGITFPKPILANRRVLIETFHHGLSLRMVLDNGPTLYDKKLADLGVRAFMQMILRDNFFHCDLHPGNMLVTFTRTPDAPSVAQRAGAWLTGKLDPSKSQRAQNVLFPSQSVDAATLNNLSRAPRDAWPGILKRMMAEGYEPQIVILDAGIVSSLSDHNLKNIHDSFRAGVEYDGVRVADLLLSRCKEPENVFDPEGARKTLDGLMRDVQVAADGQLLLSTIHTSKVITRVADLLRTHRIGLDGEFVGLFVCCVIVEGIGRRLFAEMDLIEPLADYLM
ncbi:ABC1 family-domain-containing protein [Phlyctochytrium arcticum]|nr:ABC1 family-domain-containing protein [Phlyctochytrium arcticum]